MKTKKLFSLVLLGLLCSVGNVWGTDPKFWDFQRSYSSDSETGLTGSNNVWKYKSNVYTYQSALSSATLKKDDGNDWSVAEGLTFTAPAGKVKLGKGYLLFDNDDSENSVTITTTANRYVNIVVGVGTAAKSISVTGGDKNSVTLAKNGKKYSFNIKASGTSMKFSISDAKLYIYQIALIDEEDVIATPTANYAEGSYYKGVQLTLSSTAGSSIQYKQGGTSDNYAIDDCTTTTSPFTMSSSGARKFTAYAYKDVTGGTLYSDLTELVYTRVDAFPTPTASPVAGTYNTTQNVVLSAEGMLPNGVIRYTTDGTSPTKSSTEYTSPIEVSATKTIKAYVFDLSGSNKGSSMLTAAYTIVPLEDPVFSLSATSIGTDETAQIKVGSNAGLDGITLSNIAYGTPDVVTVSDAGVVTPIAKGTTTITFDTEETAKYNATADNELTITVTDPTCSITYNAGGGSGSMSANTGIVNGGSQTLSPNAFTRDCYSFSHWTADKDVTINSAIVTAGSAIAADATIQNITSNITLTAQWTPVYSSSLDFAAQTLAKINEGTDPPAIATFLSSGNMVASSLGSSSWETGSDWGGNIKTGFLGYKLKNGGAKVSFMAQEGKLVTIVLGSIAASVTLSKNGVESTISAKSGDNAETVVTPFVASEDMLITLTTSTGSTVTLKKILIQNCASGIISASGWNTFSSSYPLDLSSISGGTAYYASAVSEGIVTLTSTTEIVQAGEGLMIKGNEDDTFIIVAAESGTSITGNMLVGLPSGGTVIKNNNNYVFGWSDSADPGFYLVNDAQPVLGAGKAYLHTAVALAPGLRIAEGENNATDMQSIENSSEVVKFIENGQILIKRDGVVYDAVGRKIR